MVPMPSSGTTHASGVMPGVEDVDRIVALEDPLLRNLEITLGYHALAKALAPRCGKWSSWCCFAVWASRQAGQTIRGEDLTAVLEQQLLVPTQWTHPFESLWRAVLRAGIFSPNTFLGRIARAIESPLSPLAMASDALARGNKMIFGEMGHQFARFLNICPADGPRDDARLTEFLSGLAPGDPPNGQDHLHKAFTHFYAAQYETDEKAKAELLLLANLEIALHEQIRVQPLLAEAFDAPMEEAHRLGERLAMVLLPAVFLKYAALRAPFTALLGVLGTPIERFRLRLARRVITQCLMTLRLPGGRTLRLGQKVDNPVPEELRVADNPELRRMLWLLEDCTPGKSDCGAEDWAELRDRMHYIVHYFRAFSEDSSLLEPPFTPAEIEQIRSGHLPDGDLT
jgi:hypothetical protein